MNKQQNGQRAQILKSGNVRVGHLDDEEVFVKQKTAEQIAASRAKAIAARRKEFARA